ncbi:hypothetical protein [Neobacillus sp. Marseille-QA0830]
MKINDFYRDAAKISLNDSIAALFPSLLIVGGNFAFFNEPDIMKLAIPFLFYSIFCFHIYLFRIRQSIRIVRNIKKNMIPEETERSLFEAQQLLVLYQNCQYPKLQLYFPDGVLAGSIKKIQLKRFMKWRTPKTYALFNNQEESIGLFQLQAGDIKVYDRNMVFRGSFKKKKLRKKVRGQLVDQDRKVIGSVEGSTMFMDEQVLNENNREVARLRRGWMPLEWSPLFPEPNTPVLSLSGDLSESEKLLGMAFLIQEYFVER